MQKREIKKMVPVRTMQEQTVVEFEAIDGTIHDTEAECIEYEQKLEASNKLKATQDAIRQKYQLKSCEPTLFDIDNLDYRCVLHIPQDITVNELVIDLQQMGLYANNIDLNDSHLTQKLTKETILLVGDYLVMTNYDDSDYPYYYIMIYSLDYIISKLNSEINFIKSKYANNK